MQLQQITLQLHADEIKFLAAFFMGRIADEGATAEVKKNSQNNFELLAPYLDADAKAELYEAAKVIYNPQLSTKMKAETKDFFNKLKSYLAQ